MQPNQSVKTCFVCGDHASIVNYGVLSYLPCRTFFRRNGFHPKRIPEESTFDRSPGDNNLDRRASDRFLISNIAHAFDAFSPIGEIRRMMELVKTSPSNLQYNLSQSIQLLSLCYHDFQSSVSATHHFKILTSAEQCSLFQRNFVGILCGSGLCLLQESRMFDKTENESVVLLLYGTDVTEKIRHVTQQFNCDPIVMKLILITHAFSSNYYMIDSHGELDQDSLLFGSFSSIRKSKCLC
ncbi:unnamed protein product [Rotaria magnacalcarata]